MKIEDFKPEDRMRIIQMEYEINSLKHENKQEVSVPLMRGNPLIKSFGVDESVSPVPVVSAVFTLIDADKGKYKFSHIE